MDWSHRRITVGAGIAGLAIAEVSLSVSVNVAPPALPVYVQPPIPGDYMRTPGYWAWSNDVQDYYCRAPKFAPQRVSDSRLWGVEGAVFI
jgi:hypothetical protein